MQRHLPWLFVNKRHMKRDWSFTSETLTPRVKSSQSYTCFQRWGHYTLKWIEVSFVKLQSCFIQRLFANWLWKMPLTPKLHVLVQHVEQWINWNRRSLGKEGEASGEALHHTFKHMLEGQGEVKGKESENYVKVIFSTPLRINGNHTWAEMILEWILHIF